MSRRYLVLSAVLLLSFATAAPGRADDTLVREFSAGSGPGAVGIVEPGEDADTEGPQAIYAGDRGEIYLLDQLNGRILQFDPSEPSRPPQSLALPEDLRPTDIVVSADTIYTWDGQVRALQATGPADAPTRGLSVTRSGEPPDEAIGSAFAQMGSQPIEAEDGLTRRVGQAAGRGRQIIASHGRGAMTADFSPVADEAGVEINLRPKGSAGAALRLRLQVRSRLGAVEVLDVDRQGRAYVLAENIPTDFSDQASAFVARYAASGALEGVHELPLDSTVAVSRRFVTVTPNGDVYFLRNRKGATDVLGVGFRPLKGAGVIDTGPPRPQLSFADLARRRGANAAVRPLTRARVLETAQAFAAIRWRVNRGAYGGDPDSVCSGFNRVRRPGYLHGKADQEVQGIPYCWGCMGSLPQIASNIEHGVKAGNICTRNDPRRDVTGVDCSAFVSASWGLSTHFTTIAIPSITKPVANPFELLPGDALNKPGAHVMLFVRFTPDRKAEVIEASTGGCNGKVCRNVYPLGSLLARGYQPVRYRGLVDAPDPTPVATARPGAAAAGAR
ncbi:hypothetical protein [Alsobacter sp. SYSU BS001988]